MNWVIIFISITLLYVAAYIGSSTR